MKDRDIDAALEKSANQLRGKLDRLVKAGLLWDESTVRRVQRIVRDHRLQVHETQGLEFPEVVPLVFHSVRFIQLVRRDLEAKAIQQTIMNLMQVLPISPKEMAIAIGVAFPDYSKSVALDLAAHAQTN
jgi:hypothetical protein